MYTRAAEVRAKGAHQPSWWLNLYLATPFLFLDVPTGSFNLPCLSSLEHRRIMRRGGTHQAVHRSAIWFRKLSRYILKMAVEAPLDAARVVGTRLLERIPMPVPPTRFCIVIRSTGNSLHPAAV